MFSNIKARIVCCVVVPSALLAANPVCGQTVVESTVPTETPAPVAETRGPSFSQVLKDTARDFKRLPSRQSLTWLTIGAAASMLGHSRDLSVTGTLARPRFDDTFGSGNLMGSLPLQVGGALATYTIGRATNQPRVMRVGAELFRAQTLAQTVTWAAKYSFNRTRPDGTRFSFPSGHTSVSFASATVLQQNFGWKVGIPAYGVASYIATSRIQMKRHYLSDVAFGAALGIVAGRTVSIGQGKARFAVAPMAAPGGGGIAFTLIGRR